MAKLQLPKNVTLKLWIISMLITDVQTNNCNDDFVKKTIGLIDSCIWNGTAQTLRNCARMCVSRTPCQSINYDYASKACELNNGTLGDRPTKTGPTLVYSSFAWWPASIDECCYSRPCADHQVCIAGPRKSPTTDCSYYCMSAGRKVCPWPNIGLHGERYVGDTNVLICGPGLTGSDTATCLENGQWDKDMACTEILNHPCSDHTLCSNISAVCTDGRCACDMVYDSTTSHCKEILNHPCSDHTLCSNIRALCTNGRCACDTNMVYDSTTSHCKLGLKLVQLHSNAVWKAAGYLTLLINGEWCNIRYEEPGDWNWQATNVACWQLGHKYGGTFSKDLEHLRQPEPLPSYRLENIKCNQTVDSLDLCSFKSLRASDHSNDQDIALGCFHFDIKADTHVYVDDSAGGFLFVKFDNDHSARPVCMHDWGENERTVACKTINPTFQNTDVTFTTSPNTEFKARAVTFSCDGSEPHLLFCRSKGLGRGSTCLEDKYVHITCEGGA